MTVIEQRLMDALANAARKYSNPKIDWEQRRYEIAKNMMAAFMTAPGDWATWNSLEDLAKQCVKYADGLINELKKKTI